MGVVRLFGKGGSLCDTEAVLLIGDDQRKVGQVNPFREQSVSSDDEVHHAQSQSIPDIPLFPCGHRTAQQCQTHPKRLQQSGQALIVLLGKDFGGGHQRRQIAVLEGNIAGSCGDHRFSRADISLHQTIHRSAAAKVAANLLDGTLLGAGQLEGQLLKKRSKVGLGADIGGLGEGVTAHRMKSEGKHQQLLED